MGYFKILSAIAMIAKPFSTFIRLLLISWPPDIMEGVKEMTVFGKTFLLRSSFSQIKGRTRLSYQRCPMLRDMTKETLKKYQLITYQT